MGIATADIINRTLSRLYDLDVGVGGGEGGYQATFINSPQSRPPIYPQYIRISRKEAFNITH
jgi:hypothetical protein